jgi:hypothetical protein
LGIEVLAGDIYLTTEPLRGGGLINDREARRRAGEVFKVMEVDIGPGRSAGQSQHRILAAHRDSQGPGTGRSGADHG